jgi:hypothetical protein
MICGCGSWINLQREEMPPHTSRGSYERDSSYGSETQSMRLQGHNTANGIRQILHSEVRCGHCESRTLRCGSQGK